jgi:hypothetical protein
MEVVPCCSMPKLSMTFVSTQATMLTLMRRRETGSGGALTLSFVTISTQSGPTTTTSWSTWPSPRRIASQLARQRRRGRPLWQGHQHSLNASGLCSTLRVEDLNNNRGDGDPTTTAAAGTQSLSTPSSEEQQSAAAATAAVPPGQ